MRYLPIVSIASLGQGVRRDRKPEIRASGGPQKIKSPGRVPEPDRGFVEEEEQQELESLATEEEAGSQ